MCERDAVDDRSNNRKNYPDKKVYQNLKNIINFFFINFYITKL